jgi:hypothetical protein
MQNKKSKAQTMGFYNSGHYCKIPTAVSFVSMAVRFGAKYFAILNRKRFPSTNGTLYAFFINDIQQSKFSEYIGKRFNLTNHFANSKTYYSQNFTSFYYSVEIPLLEIPISNKYFFKSFREFSRQYKSIFPASTAKRGELTNTKSYHKTK